VLIADIASDEYEVLEPQHSPYWAPEVQPQSAATAAQDLYSLGAIGWLLASGSPPGSAGVSPGALNQLLTDLLQADPGLRPSSPRAGASPIGRIARRSSAPSLEEQGELARQALEQYLVLDLATVESEREVALLLPVTVTVARSVQDVVVARPAEDELILALKDPTFVHAYDYVRMAVGSSFQVRLTRAEPGLIDQALEYLYRAEVYSETVGWAEWLVRRQFHSLPLVVENPIADTSIWGEPLPNRVIDAVDTLLKEALAVGASDIHFKTFHRWMDVRAI